MKVPDINKITFIINRMIIGFVVIDNKLSPIICGIPVKAITHDKIFETPIKNTTIALILADSTKIFIIFLKFRFLYRSPRIKEYTTEIADPSVAVNTPITIPPITTTISPKDGRAAKVALPRFDQENLPSVPLYPFFLATATATIVQARAQINPGM